MIDSGQWPSDKQQAADGHYLILDVVFYLTFILLSYSRGGDEKKTLNKIRMRAG